MAEGKPSARTEVVYNIEAYRAGLPQGDWKLVGNVTLPSRVELYDIAHDPSELTNLADKNPDSGSSAAAARRIACSRGQRFPCLSEPDMRTGGFYAGVAMRF